VFAGAGNKKKEEAQPTRVEDDVQETRQQAKERTHVLHKRTGKVYKVRTMFKKKGSEDMRYIVMAGKPVKLVELRGQYKYVM
jgi:hypothetical protein